MSKDILWRVTSYILEEGHEEGAGERDRVKEGREELVEESQRLNRVVGLSRNSPYVNDPSSNLYIVLPANFNEEAEEDVVKTDD